MDVQSFKIKYPHLAHLESNELWNAMEDALLHENKEIQPKPVTDWQGNMVKAGDEVCFIKIRTGGMFTAAFLIPDQKGGYTEHNIPDEPETDCWEVGECIKVEEGLRYTTVQGEFTFTQPLSLLTFCMDSRHILAIKGVSDKRPD